jgi:hypothetical protein
MRLRAELCLRLQRGCGVRAWGPDGLGTGGQGRGREGAEGVDVDYGAASLLAANWSGASPDEGRFPVRPSRLTPNGAWRRTP